MAFKIKDMGVLAYAHGSTYWYYRTEDTTEAVREADYFADAAYMLRTGDRIAGATSDCKAVDLFVEQNDIRGVKVEPI